MKKLYAFFILLLCNHACTAAVVEKGDEKELTVKVNILEPPCRLKSITSDVSFDEFSMVDVISGKVVRDVTLDFQYCLNTNSIRLFFSGNDLSLKDNALIVKNQEGYSSGMLIKLLHSGSEIDLSKYYSIPANALDITHVMQAKVVPIYDELVNYRSGDFKSSLGLTIQYN
ncbi:fimbrial protein [Escherichia coli]|uniref:fimbrial protein n=1 Tax=Escherichia coli TaxID=562 RepID=UPI001ABC1B22|nr:hypothetical protein [Escherichia coli]MBS9069680.1 hypothetical protein [Escherichia coli]